jgi:hypothetical protein
VDSLAGTFVMATRKTFEIRSRSRGEAKAAAGRLSKFLKRSESNLVEILILNSERTQLERMTPEERAKYLAGKLTFADAVEIEARWRPPSNGTGSLPSPVPNAQVVNPKAPDAQCWTHKGAA